MDRVRGVNMVSVRAGGEHVFVFEEHPPDQKNVENHLLRKK